MGNIGTIHNSKSKKGGKIEVSRSASTHAANGTWGSDHVQSLPCNSGILSDGVLWNDRDEGVVLRQALFLLTISRSAHWPSRVDHAVVD